MEPELKTRLLKYLDGLEAAAQKAGEFAEAEVPQTVKEYLLWLSVESFIYAALWLAFVGILVFVGKVVMGRAIVAGDEIEKANKWDGAPAGFFARAGRVACYASAVLFFFAHVPGYVIGGIKPLVAPRVVLVEKAAELITGESKK